MKPSDATDPEDEALRNLFHQAHPSLRDEGFSLAVVAALPAHRVAVPRSIWMIAGAWAGAVIFSFKLAASPDLVAALSELPRHFRFGASSLPAWDAPLAVAAAALALLYASVFVPRRARRH